MRRLDGRAPSLIQAPYRFAASVRAAIIIPDRRLFASGLAAVLASCGRSGRRSPGPPKLDQQQLAYGFPALARRARPGVFGLGVALMEPGLSWVSDATARFPLQSVSKAIMAAAALSELDAGRLRLNEPITITDLDLSPPFSLIDQAWPTPPTGHAMTLPVADLLALAVQNSDNTAADNLMKRVGGPGAVNAWLRAKDITDISIDRYELDIAPELAGMNPFQPAWKDLNVWTAMRDQVPAAAREAATVRYLHDPRDTATLPATLDFLVKLVIGQLLSPTSTRLLLRLMATSAGDNRIKAGLPPGAVVAHKTGSAATDVGLTPATNDMGIVTLADGRRVAIAGFLAGSTATAPERDRIIADGARLACSSVS